MKGLFWRTLSMALALTLLLGLALPGANALVIGSADDYKQINVWENSSATLSAGKELPVRMTELRGSQLYLKSGVSYASTNKSVASVSEKGVVTALTAGTAQIIMQAKDGDAYILKLTVLDAPTKLSFANKSLTLFTGMNADLASQLKVTPNTDIDAGQLKWKTSNRRVATVKDGVVTAQGKGTATVTVTYGQAKATIKVKVRANKLDNINPMPPVTAAPSDKFALVLKSLEIVSPKRVVAEYYLALNRSTRYQTKRFRFIDATLYGFDRIGKKKVTVIDGRAFNVPVSARGRTVSVVTVNYTGGCIVDTNVCLKNCAGQFSVKEYSARLEYQ